MNRENARIVLLYQMAGPLFRELPRLIIAQEEQHVRWNNPQKASENSYFACLKSDADVTIYLVAIPGGGIE